MFDMPCICWFKHLDCQIFRNGNTHRVKTWTNIGRCCWDSNFHNNTPKGGKPSATFLLEYLSYYAPVRAYQLVRQNFQCVNNCEIFCCFKFFSNSFELCFRHSMCNHNDTSCCAICFLLQDLFK